MKRLACLAGLTLGGMIILAQTSGTGETVTTKFERAIPNIPGKSLVSVVVDYAPGGPRPHTPTQNRLSFMPTSSRVPSSHR
jgi:hypothetical protein